MTAVEVPLRMRLDVALDELVREREWTLACGEGFEQAVRLAELYQLEARLWSSLFEHVRIRIYWRAALAAEAHARQCAAYWQAVAADRTAPIRAVMITDGRS